VLSEAENGKLFGSIMLQYLHGITSLYYGFMNGTKIEVASMSLANKNTVSGGAWYKWDNDKYSAYREGIGQYQFE